MEEGIRRRRRLVEFAGSLLLYVLGQTPRRRAGAEDALDGLALEGAKGAGVAKRRAQVTGGEALAQEQDLSGVVTGAAWLGAQQAGEEERALLAQVGEGLLELVEISAPST